MVVGTAGHVDHGKTELIKALTGIDCDRWEEEKRRGISIDLGFAHLDAEGVQIGFIDVPGHQRFLDNALAGLGGVRMLLLVVAANEGVMPQTREHVAIASLLGIPAALVALTKADLASPELAEVARLEVEELLASSPWAAAEIVPVSSRTGCGLAELKRHLVELGREFAVPSDPEAPARLPIDRAFHLPGRGVVVTGTLLSGVIRPGDELEILRLGKLFKVRSIQVHHQERDQARAGERTSLLLRGAELPELMRGQQLVCPGAFELSRRLCARFTLLADAPAPLKARTECRLHLLAEETIARLSPLEPAEIEPGQEGLVAVTLRRPMPVVRGDRWIARRPSPAALLGGGEVMDPQWRRRRCATAAPDLARLCGDREEALMLWIERAGPAGATTEELARHQGVAPATLRSCLEKLVGAARLRRFPRRADEAERWVAESTFGELRASALRLVGEHFERDRFSLGMCKNELFSRLLPGIHLSLAELLVRKLVRAGALELAAGRVSIPGRVPALTATEEQLLDELRARYEAAGLHPPTLAEVTAAAPVPAEVVAGLLRLLVARGELLTLANHELIAASAVEQLRQTLLATGWERVTVPQLCELFGLTRRWAVPLLELCDTLGVTRRIGMDRTIIFGSSETTGGKPGLRDGTLQGPELEHHE